MIQNDPGPDFPIVQNGIGVHALLLHPIMEQDFGDALRKKTFFSARDPELTILIAPDHVSVVTADAFPRFTPEQGAVTQTVPLADRAKIVFGRLDHFFHSTEMAQVAVNDADVRLFRQYRNHQLEHVRGDPIVRIEWKDVCAAGFPDACVARAGKAAVFLFDEANPVIRMVLNEPASHNRRVVRAAIVHNDQFPVGKRLRDHAAHRFGQIAGLIEARDNDGNQRNGVNFFGGQTSDVQLLVQREYARCF